MGSPVASWLSSPAGEALGLGWASSATTFRPSRYPAAAAKARHTTSRMMRNFFILSVLPSKAESSRLRLC